jgi:mono/diheme cytochrome c family protein
MQRVLLLLLLSTTLAWLPVQGPDVLRTERASAGDLEVGGELDGLPVGTTRYIRYEDLLRLPQETYSVTDDSNFRGKTEISGVSLDTLARLFGGDVAAGGLMVVAICYDKYRTNYPREYMKEHHPLLVLRINGMLRDQWPKSEHGGPLVPYLISHPFFKPAFKVLSHEDEPQVPFGVTRLELRQEAVVFGAIRPPGEWPANSQVGQGYSIARQDCFRCHNMGAEGGTLAGRSWLQLAEDASEDGKKFQQTIRDPTSVRAGAKMPAHANYDDATLSVLTAYFRIFAASGGAR